MDEKTLVLLGTLSTIVLGVIGSIVAWYSGGQELQGNSREIIRKMFNFEICLFCAALIISVVPFIGALVAPAFFVVNLIVALKAYNAVTKGTEFDVPCIEIIK